LRAGIQGSDNGQGPTQSIIQPLAHGVPGRVAKLRAAGNAIVPQVAAEFIKASMT
jgi:DNA (cytosine-5)-methyltransferase 1